MVEAENSYPSLRQLTEIYWKIGNNRPCRQEEFRPGYLIKFAEWDEYTALLEIG